MGELQFRTKLSLGKLCPNTLLATGQSSKPFCLIFLFDFVVNE